MAPFDFVASVGKVIGYLVFLLVGMGFGAVLEMSGFGDSRKLAGQFYFKDMTVLKVMFTGIVVAMVLIFSFSSMELLDFSRVYVNPTYLFPGIIGGLIMGVGFIVGGFCPGTSIVALATLKVDGMLFAAGVACGAFLFGESLSVFQGFHNSTYMGRFMLPELLGIGTGPVVLLVVLMALAMFYWAEIGEKVFGEKKAWQEIPKIPGNKGKILASATLVFVALALVFFCLNYASSLYQTLPVLLLAYLILFLPQAMGAQRASLLQVTPSLEEAGRSLGSRPSEVLRRITLPLLRSGLLAGALLVFLTSMKELPAALILSPMGYTTLSTQVWTNINEAFFARAAAPALLLLLLSSLPLAIMTSRDSD